LFQETEHYRLAEIAVIFFVHIQDLFKGRLVDIVAEVEVGLARQKKSVLMCKKKVNCEMLVFQ